MISTLAIVLAGGTLVALGVVAYAYFVYPIVIGVCARLFGRSDGPPTVPDDELPTVTLVIAAWNEAQHIGPRIENALASNYPASKFRIVVASDGSTDATSEIVRQYASDGVKLLPFPDRRGKAAVLNDVLPRIKSDIIMLTDANTYTRPDAARKLAVWFRDPSVGVVCGKLILTDPAVGRNVDGVYWKYETFLKKCESRLGALLGSNGGIYAMRKTVYQPIPTDTIVDDFVIPLLAKKHTGCRIVYETGAVAHEEVPAHIACEFHRRARIGAGGFQSIGMLKSLLSPRYGWLAFAFLNHKVLRWICPFFLLAAILGNLAVIALAMPGLGAEWLLPPAAALLALQVVFYLLSALSGTIPTRPKVLKVLRLPAMFTSMNAALAVGFWRWWRGQQAAAWKRTARTGEAALLLATLDDTGEMIPLPASGDSAVRPVYSSDDSTIGMEAVR